MKANIVINKEEVLAEVARRSAYAGVKTDDANAALFDRVATVDEDGDLLNAYWRDGCASVADGLKDFLAVAGFGDASLTLELQLSDAFDAQLLAPLQQEIFSWLTAMLLCRWFRLALPAKATEWQAEAERLRAAVISKAYHRAAPRRR